MPYSKKFIGATKFCFQDDFEGVKLNESQVLRLIVFIV
jgi:hypothetical protein